MLPAREDGLAGQNLPRLDVPAKIDGSANFAADIRLPNMVFASIRQGPVGDRSEEHTSELQPLMRSSYAVFCLNKKITKTEESTYVLQYIMSDSEALSLVTK